MRVFISHEVEVLLIVDEELERAGVLVLHGLGQLDGGAAHRLARGWRDEGRRRFFQQLLVAALDGAIALPHMHDLAEPIAEDLELDVVRVLDQLFQIKCAIVEGLFRLHLGGIEALNEADVIVRLPHAASAAARDGLDHDRVADLLGDLQRVLVRFDNTRACLG